MDKKELILNSKINGAEKILEYSEKNLHLTYASTREILEFFYELENSKGVSAGEFLTRVKLEYGTNKKQNTSKFLRYLKAYRNPVMAESMDKLKKLNNSLKNKKIKISYPENLEGDSFKLEMDINSEKDVELLASYMEGKLDKLKELIKLIKRGG